MSRWLKVSSIYWLKVIGLNILYVYLGFVAWLYVPTGVGKIAAFLVVSFVIFHIWIKWHHQRNSQIEA